MTDIIKQVRVFDRIAHKIWFNRNFSKGLCTMVVAARGGGVV